jgi:creatinine amidohydrolase
MKLAHLTWQDVRDVSRETLVVVPTGSMEQHGPHLPLITDSLLVTAVVEGAEKNIADWMLMTPTVWLGCSYHHMPFPGTVSASFEGYEQAVWDLLSSLTEHGFHKIFLVNGHGGNSSPHDVVLRKWKHHNPAHTVGSVDYYKLFPQSLLDQNVRGPLKAVRHACEIETSLMLHLAPELVRLEASRDDGLRPEEPVSGVVWNYDELTEDGGFGYPTLATAELGQVLFESAVEKLTELLVALASGFSLVGIDEREQEPTA